MGEDHGLGLHSSPHQLKKLGEEVVMLVSLLYHPRILWFFANQLSVFPESSKAILYNRVANICIFSLNYDEKEF